MISGIIFLSVALAFMMYIGIYRKNMFYSFARFFLPLGISGLYFQIGWEGFPYIMVTMLIISGYSLYEVTQMRK